MPLSVPTRGALQCLIVYAGFVLIFLFFAITPGDRGFLTIQNLSNIVLQTAPATVMAIGLVFVLSSGEIDLSFGAIVALSAIVAANIMREHHWLPGVVAGLGTGLTAGLLNGLVVAYAKLPSFLVTLASMGIIAGLAREISELQSIPVTATTFIGLFGGGHRFGVPALVYWTFGVLVIGHVIFRETCYGAHVRAVGDNARGPCFGHSGCKDQAVGASPFGLLCGACGTALCRSAAIRALHPWRDRSHDCNRSRNRWRDGPDRRSRHDPRGTCRIADDGNVVKRPDPDGALRFVADDHQGSDRPCRCRRFVA